MPEPLVHVQIKIPGVVRDALREMGEKEQRSLSAEIRLVLMRHTQEHREKK